MISKAHLSFRVVKSYVSLKILESQCEQDPRPRAGPMFYKRRRDEG
ncbi:unnamed protein product [Paramecium sonneborni]|uniref:Uncharacterized protein n=1 Tax=Paramecium sonneborni TaxID=65129 RepID=A0A8S1NIK5_9CILI|nr:unnamed protein product [Paramecium sonneborni]